VNRREFMTLLGGARMFWKPITKARRSFIRPTLNPRNILSNSQHPWLKYAANEG
jgi:hypothetical protein